MMPFALRLSAEERAILDRMAREEDRSTAYVLRRLIRPAGAACDITPAVRTNTHSQTIPQRHPKNVDR